MAEDMPDDMEGFDTGMLEWFYVEDDYPLADELAETQVASPGYAGTKYEIDREAFDFDMFDFWDDLQYGDDEYWDTPVVRSGQKRKRDGLAPAKTSDKRRKIGMEETGGENVQFVSIAVRNQMAKKQPPLLDGHPPFSLLPDWKERFADDTGVLVKKAMPAEMKKAAESKDTDSPTKKLPMNAMVTGADEEDGDWVDEDEDEEEEGTTMDLASAIASIDPKIIEGFLKQELGNSGMEGLDEGAFMQAITQMLTGGQSAEDAVGELTNSILGQAMQGNDTALSGWLSQQGVSLDAAGEQDDDTSSVGGSELPETSTSKARQSIQSSPPDSAIEMLKGATPSTEMTMHPSSPSASAKKRMAPAEDSDVPKKRKKVTFNVPPSPELTRVTMNDVEDRTEEDDKPDPPTSEDPLNSEPNFYDDDDTIAVSSKAANSAPTKNNNHKSEGANSTTKAKSKVVKQALSKADADVVNDAGIDSIEVARAKNTRKRKAQREEDEDEIEGAAHTQKKQAKKGATASSDGPPAKRTRSARAKVGK